MVIGSAGRHVIVDGEADAVAAAVAEDVHLQQVAGVKEHLARRSAGEIFADQPAAGVGVPGVIEAHRAGAAGQQVDGLAVVLHRGLGGDDPGGGAALLRGQPV